MTLFCHFWKEKAPMSLVAWRLRFGDCSWISDYRVNYRDHNHLHNCVQATENLDAPTEDQEDVAVIDRDKDDDEVEVEVEIEVDEAENKHATTTKTTATKRTLRPQNSQSPNIPARRPKRRLFVQEKKKKKKKPFHGVVAFLLRCSFANLDPDKQGSCSRIHFAFW
jgi:hypothetical protein